MVSIMLLAGSDGWIRHRFSASRSVLITFSRKPSRWMEGHDLGEPEDWYPAVAARSRRCLVSTSIAKQPEREIRPAISRSPSLPPFLRFFSSTFVKLVLSPSLPLSFSCSLIFTANPGTIAIIRTEKILGACSKIAFRRSASTERKWSLRQRNEKKNSLRYSR